MRWAAIKENRTGVLKQERRKEAKQDKIKWDGTRREETKWKWKKKIGEEMRQTKKVQLSRKEMRPEWD